MRVLIDLFRKLDQMMDRHTISQEERFFSSIFGYNDIKRLLMRCIIAKEPIHLLLTGPPACCKIMFVLEIAKGLDKTYFMDATSASGPGMSDYLFENIIKYLLIDEIDKPHRRDQSVLLNLMENNVLVETKVRKTRK